MIKAITFTLVLLTLTLQSCETTNCVDVCDQMSTALQQLQTHPTPQNYQTHSDLYDLYRADCQGCQTVESWIEGNGYYFHVYHCLGCTDRKMFTKTQQ